MIGAATAEPSFRRTGYGPPSDDHTMNLVRAERFAWFALVDASAAVADLSIDDARLERWRRHVEACKAAWKKALGQLDAARAWEVRIAIKGVMS
jgi:hypothetical protein